MIKAGDEISMKTYDQRSSLFWLFFSILFCIGSLRLGIGKPGTPGMGFMSFGASVLLGVLSVALFLKTTLKKDGPAIERGTSGALWKRVLLVLIALLAYVMLLDGAGYLITTFVFMSFLFWITKRPKLRWILMLSFSTTFVTYYVFVKWLNCQFPHGFFGF